MGINIYLSMNFDAKLMGDPKFGEWSFLYKFFYYNMAMSMMRYLYYIAWVMNDTNAIAMGFGYNGYDEKTRAHKWDTIEGINILGVETSVSLTQSVIHWNHQVHKYLKNYVQMRLLKVG